MAKAQRRKRSGPRSKHSNESARALASVVSLAEVSADSLEAVLEKIDGEVFHELKAIALHIETLREEIAALQPDKMHRESIPAAGQELDAIVGATESASNAILECGEQVMAADARDPQRYKAFVEARMLKIFEACSFQDLTGQRIAKVIDTLKQIEARVARFARVARAKDARKRRPTPPDRANSQEAVDRILRTDKKRSAAGKRR